LSVVNPCKTVLPIKKKNFNISKVLEPYYWILMMMRLIQMAVITAVKHTSNFKYSITFVLIFHAIAVVSVIMCACVNFQSVTLI
jgi:hypothetical protein